MGELYEKIARTPVSLAPKPSSSFATASTCAMWCSHSSARPERSGRCTSNGKRWETRSSYQTKSAIENDDCGAIRDFINDSTATRPRRGRR
jgi:hypothetical protein